MAEVRVEFIDRSFLESCIQQAESNPNPEAVLQLLADACRFNTLSAIKLAGSGHLGSSFSAMDIVVWLYARKMNTAHVGFGSPDRDIYFSSKGHDVPGLYSVLNAFGVVSDAQLRMLRRLDGLDGHPNVRSFGVEANSGSLGMGISKGRGMAWAKNVLGHGGHVYVLTGDGELQEGQNYEALQTTVHQKVNGLTVIVDHNKLQTDKFVNEITDLGELEQKFQAFGWAVARCDGHSFRALDSAVSYLQSQDRPGILIADTVKGKGVSFMEAQADGSIYLWHSGAPADEPFMAASTELLNKVSAQADALGWQPPSLNRSEYTPKAPSKTQMEFVAQGYGDALMELAPSRPDIVVLDGDLSADCRVRSFEYTYPDRFVENGIAEQDMASMAGGMARIGLLPFVNSFSSFLSSRANEQIYTNACEGTKIVYACHFAGMIPAGPGKSHQSVRDIGLLGSIPNLAIFQPGTAEEARLATHWCAEAAKENVALRLCIGPSPRKIDLPTGYSIQQGRGWWAKAGGNDVLIAYGPVMLNEALTAAEDTNLAVLAMPWLNRFDLEWLQSELAGFRRIFVLDDHMVGGGLGERLAGAFAETGFLQGREYRIFGLREYPECGTPLEVLQRHELDGASLARAIFGTATAAATGAYTDAAPQ